MAFVPTTNTSFIGDSFLMKYLHIYLKLPITRQNVSYGLGNGTSILHCDFAFPDQRLYQAMYNTEMLRGAGYQLQKKVVVFIGVYDILDFIKGSNRSRHMTMDLLELIHYLLQRDVKEIILCTIPLVAEAPCQGIMLTDFYNSYIKAYEQARMQGLTIKVADISSVLHFAELFESNGSSPNVDLYRRMHEVLREFI